MAGIAGIAAAGRQQQVRYMLDSLAHRGKAGSEVFECGSVTLGAVWPQVQAGTAVTDRNGARDDAGAGHWAAAQVRDGKLVLERDPIGVAPLYYGLTGEGILCFASEVKALLRVTNDIREVPPGHVVEGQQLREVFRLEQPAVVKDPPDRVAGELRRRLGAAVKKCIRGEAAGSWLSGGLDSSTMAALARPNVSVLHTFVAGLPGAPDLDFARQVAAHIGSEHHEVVVSFEQMLEVLPDVIFHLESFDALLVRSSITNYLVARAASQYVPTAFSGEGGDELFAGYAYLKAIDPQALSDELLDITGRLHNTALQRVDRCASACGLVAHVCFLDPQVVEYALRIPSQMKMHEGVEKWILRRAADGLLPAPVLARDKSKFWEGAGVGDLLADYANGNVSDADFSRERVLPNGWTLASKEELIYYRIFKERFGSARDLAWMGRTKGA
jgi:asparagine synthase (glutamine-hydrolysing)